MVTMSKRHAENRKLVDKEKTYTVEEGVEILKKASQAKFDETVDIAIALKIDVTHSDQLVRGSFSFPNGIGKSVRLVAITEESRVEEALEAGAAEAGGEELVKKIADGWMDFDVVVAQPSMMRHLGKLGRVLGPRGLMPSPKSGTVSDNVGKTVKEFAAGKIEFRNDRQGNILVPVGKISFDTPALAENIRAFYDHIVSVRPSAVKGSYIKGVHISSTMGPGIQVSF